MRNLIRSTSIAVVLMLVVAAGALAKPEAVQVGNLVLTHDGAVSPTTLPRHKQAPIGAWISTAIATRDDSHIPAVREAVIDVDDDVQVNVKGLAVCKGGQLRSRDSKAARRVCGKAIVGKGTARAEIEFPEQKPIMASSPLTIFNGGVKSRPTTLFVHAFITVPVPAAVVTTVKITRIHRGPFGLEVAAKIPPISGGAGSLADAKFEVGRKFTYRGKKSSFLTASCPSGRHLIHGRVLFRDGTALNLARVLPCTASG
jgi:hypothetical protein